jgi:hypothetical protein
VRAGNSEPSSGGQDAQGYHICSVRILTADLNILNWSSAEPRDSYAGHRGGRARSPGLEPRASSRGPEGDRFGEGCSILRVPLRPARGYTGGKPDKSPGPPKLRHAHARYHARGLRIRFWRRSTPVPRHRRRGARATAGRGPGRPARRPSRGGHLLPAAARLLLPAGRDRRGAGRVGPVRPRAEGRRRGHRRGGGGARGVPAAGQGRPGGRHARRARPAARPGAVQPDLRRGALPGRAVGGGRGGVAAGVGGGRDVAEGGPGPRARDGGGVHPAAANVRGGPGGRTPRRGGARPRGVGVGAGRAQPAAPAGVRRGASWMWSPRPPRRTNYR